MYFACMHSGYVCSAFTRLALPTQTTYLYMGESLQHSHVRHIRQRRIPIPPALGHLTKPHAGCVFPLFVSRVEAARKKNGMCRVVRSALVTLTHSHIKRPKEIESYDAVQMWYDKRTNEYATCELPQPAIFRFEMTVVVHERHAFGVCMCLCSQVQCTIEYIYPFHITWI